VKKGILLLLILCLSSALAAAESPEVSDFLKVENGMLQPVIEWSDFWSAVNFEEGNDILRFCVWVETDYDTDLDGKADLVKAMIQIPRAAAEGKYRAGVIYDPLPYTAGPVYRYSDSLSELYTEEIFESSRFYRECTRREPAGSMTSLEAAARADSVHWDYVTPDDYLAYQYNAQIYDYFLVRGYAVVLACGIGTYGSEGFELCGTKLERDSHKAVVEWLTGDRRAFTDRTSNIEIAADWSNGNVAMVGCSYGGALAYEVAVTGVKGLKTIISFAGIASWYDYTNSQGIPITNLANYTDSLAALNCGGTFLDESWDVPNREYGSWLWTVAMAQDEANGDYTPVWEEMDFTTEAENHLACPGLIVAGLNDFNVTPRHADRMVEAFRKAGQPVKLVLHWDAHNILNGFSVNGRPWEEIMNLWLGHYLFGLENDAESLPDVLAQSNITGAFEVRESWPGSGTLTLKAPSADGVVTVTSEGMSEYSDEFQESHQNNLTVEDREEFYSRMPEQIAASFRFDVPAGTTIAGTPELRVKLDSDREDLDGLMITAVLADVADSGVFGAYIPGSLNEDLVYTTELKDLLYDAGHGEGLTTPLVELEKDDVPRKIISFAWTDLQNPGCGKDPAEYVPQETGLISGKEQDYTFFFIPTVYTLAEGHHLELTLMTWDPYRACLDSLFNLDGSLDCELEDACYQMMINAGSLELVLPTE